MAHWCINTVYCSGTAAAMNTFKTVFHNDRLLQSTDAIGTSLGLADIEEGYFYSFQLLEETETSLHFIYETKWTPNLADLTRVCEQFGIAAKVEYIEDSMGVCGVANLSEAGLLSDYPLPEDLQNQLALSDSMKLEDLLYQWSLGK
jgi:hypothetical protein